MQHVSSTDFDPNPLPDLGFLLPSRAGESGTYIRFHSPPPDVNDHRSAADAEKRLPGQARRAEPRRNDDDRVKDRIWKERFGHLKIS
jgi:hypothetical protein